MEWELQQQGFDFCYDKRLYDRLEHDSPENVRLHLCADPGYQNRLVRFLENHDEPRAAAIFSPGQERAAAVVVATLPGARLFHEGQFEGRKVRPPVFLGRRPDERVDAEMRGFYRRLLQAVNDPVFRDGEWSLCDRTGWPDNPSYLNLVAWSWAKDEARYLIVVNLSDRTSQARVRAPWNDMQDETVRLVDGLSDSTFELRRDDMQANGIYVELGPWGVPLLPVRPPAAVDCGDGRLTARKSLGVHERVGPKELDAELKSHVSACPLSLSLRVAGRWKKRSSPGHQAPSSGEQAGYVSMHVRRLATDSKRHPEVARFCASVGNLPRLSSTSGCLRGKVSRSVCFLHGAPVQHAVQYDGSRRQRTQQWTPISRGDPSVSCPKTPPGSWDHRSM